MKPPFEKRLELGRWVIPKALEQKAVHRWYVFPHSFAPELVEFLIEDWGLTSEDSILDPFVGAGTTLLAARMRGVPAAGYDLSPLSVLAARAKIVRYDVDRLDASWKKLQRVLDPARWNGASRPYPTLVRRALPGRLLGAFDSIAREIDRLKCSRVERDFFRLALLAIMPRYSRAEATGGWLEWVDRRTSIRSIPDALRDQVEMMREDVLAGELAQGSRWRAKVADARKLPDRSPGYTAIITSPPYPNRHDYTRVFGVELMFGFLDWEETRRLRYQCFHSHPEAHPKRPEANEYQPPESLVKTVARIRKRTSEPRLPTMLEGYFRDMYLCLLEMRRVCHLGAKIALVVGNAQYCGEAIRVDEWTAELGEQIGLKCEKIWIARYRGNSAQQMGVYGRTPSRESVVIFRS